MFTKHQGDVYDYVCLRLEHILVRSGVRDKCEKCSQKKYIRPPKWLPHQGGCCQGCQNLEKNGCAGNSLACKFWHCNYDFLQKQLKKYNLYEEWQDLRKLSADSLGFDYMYDYKFFRKIRSQIGFARPGDDSNN